MKQLIMLFTLFALVGCGSVGVIDADNVKGTTTTLTDRTDAYIEADAEISEDQKVERMSRTADLRTYFASGGEVPAKPIATSAYFVLDMHDAYIESDETLAEFETRLAMFESGALRGVFDEAMKKVSNETQ